MGVGHAAVALGAVKAAPRVNAGWLIFAAFLADFLLGMFALLGLEQAQVPADYASRHYLTFTFPYSHGLLPLLVYGAVFGFLVSRTHAVERTRVFLVAVAVVVSHYLLDGIVHVAGLPLAGEHSPKLGLALWNHMPVALSLETVMAAAGLLLYLRIAAASAWSRWGVSVFVVVLSLLTWTQLFMTEAPGTAQLVPSWIGGPLLFAAVVYALDRKRIHLAASE